METSSPGVNFLTMDPVKDAGLILTTLRVQSRAAFQTGILPLPISHTGSSTGGVSRNTEGCWLKGEIFELTCECTCCMAIREQERRDSSMRTLPRGIKRCGSQWTALASGSMDTPVKKRCFLTTTGARPLTDFCSDSSTSTPSPSPTREVLCRGTPPLSLSPVTRSHEIGTHQRDSSPSEDVFILRCDSPMDTSTVSPRPTGKVTIRRYLKD